MKKQITFFLFWMAIAIGLEAEFYIYTQDVLTGSHYGIAFICTSLLLLYVLPAVFLMRAWQKHWHLNGLQFILPLLSGAFIAGWLSYYGNHIVDLLLEALGVTGQLFHDLGAMSAPFIEEPAKAIAAFAALSYLNKWRPKAVLVAGACAGLGFQIIEDFAYINQNTVEGLAYSIADIFGRMTGAISSHWVYTAIFVFGLYLILNQEHRDLKWGAIFSASALILHFIWNSPILDIPTPMPLIAPLIIATGLWLFYQAYHKAQTIDASH